MKTLLVQCCSDLAIFLCVFVCVKSKGGGKTLQNFNSISMPKQFFLSFSLACSFASSVRLLFLFFSRVCVCVNVLCFIFVCVCHLPFTQNLYKLTYSITLQNIQLFLHSIPYFRCSSIFTLSLHSLSRLTSELCYIK